MGFPLITFGEFWADSQDQTFFPLETASNHGKFFLQNHASSCSSMSVPEFQWCSSIFIHQKVHRLLAFLFSSSVHRVPSQSLHVPFPRRCQTQRFPGHLASSPSGPSCCPAEGWSGTLPTTSERTRWKRSPNPMASRTIIWDG